MIIKTLLIRPRILLRLNKLMLKIDTTKFEILTQLYTEELTYPFWERGISKNLYKIMTNGEIILIGNYCVEGEYKGKLGAAVFFQRENLKEVIQAIEDWLDDEKSTGKEHIAVYANGDEFGVSFGFPDRFDVRPVLMLTTNIQSEINGSEALSWNLVTDIDTGPKLIAELSKVEALLNQTQSQRLVKR